MIFCSKHVAPSAWLFASACLLGAGTAGAAATDAEIARLGQELTPVGAEKAGNKDGSIPAWSNAPMTAPAGWKPLQPRPDPFKADKPLYTITAANVEQYQAKLSAGQVELVKTLKNYKMDVYPTKRDCTYPDLVYQRSKENAKIAKLGDDGFDLGAATGAGFPFPVPKNGVEAMWNHKLRYQGEGRIEPNATIL